MSNELPPNYGGKGTDGELIKRPLSPVLPTPVTPMRAHYQPRIGYSPEEPPLEPSYTPEDIKPGLRRRPSSSIPYRESSGGEYDAARPNYPRDSGYGRSPRSRDEGHYYRDDDRGYAKRDEYPEGGARVPRSRRAFDPYERTPIASRNYDDELGIDVDLEAGHSWRTERKRISDEESVDGYNYDAHRSRRATLNFKSLTPEEKAEVMRLPWTQWMNSEFKNRKRSPSTRRRVVT